MIAVIQPPAQQAASNQGSYFDPHVVGALVVGLILGWLTHFLTTRREAGARITKARDEFFRVVAEQRAKLKSMHKREDVFFAESVPALTAAVFGLQHILPAGDWLRLRQILTEYESQRREEFGGSRDMITAYVISCQLPEDRLHKCLDRFYDCVANPVA